MTPAERQGMWLGFFAWYRGLGVEATVFVSRKMSVQR
jgi:hypothetical protein